MNILPNSFEPISLKRLASLNPYVSLPKSGAVDYVPMENIHQGYLDHQTEEISSLPSSLNAFSEGDILLAKVTPCFENGNIAIASNLLTGVGLCSTELFVLRIHSDKILPEYLMLLLQDDQFKKEAKSYMRGTGGLKRIPTDWLMSRKFLIPSLKHQRLIIQAMSSSDSLIQDIQKGFKETLDRLSSYRQSLITRAVTKGLDPNVDCMKKVPFKRFIISRNGGMWGSEPGSAEVDALCIRVADFDYANLKTRPTASTMRSISEKQLQNNQLRDGDILLEKSGGGEKTPVGRAVYYSGCEGAICSNFIERLTINRQMLNPKFACYVLSSAYSQRKNFDCIKQTTGIQNLSVDDYLSSVTVPLFDLETQQRITNWLDKQLSKVAQVITANQAQLMKLTAYRQSLISYAVTGQLAIDEEASA